MNQSVDMANLEKLKKPQGPFAFQREGKIRELASLTDLEDPTLENEILNAINKANKKDQELYNNVSISRQGMRYYTGKGPNYNRIKDQSLEIIRKQNEFADL